MTKVFFDIEFHLQDKVQFKGKASISREKASTIEGLVIPSEETIIKLNRIQPEEPKKRGRKRKQQINIQPIKSVKSQMQEQEEEDQNENQIDINELDNLQMDIQPDNQQNLDQDELNQEMEMELENQSNDYADSNSAENQQILLNFQRKKMTKRQMGQLEHPAQLPDRPRKKRNMYSEQDQIKKLEKQEKRRQYMRKQLQNQKMETLDKILNEKGRKQRQRNEKQNKQKAQKQNKIFKTLGDIPKIVYHNNSNTTYLTIHSTPLFSDAILKKPEIRKKANCYICEGNGKYRVDNKMVCSLQCYKRNKTVISVQ